MQGMKFVLLGEKGLPINHGVILQKVTEERYLCKFARKPTVSRLCHVDEIASWNLFLSDDELNDFITLIRAQDKSAEPVATIEPEENDQQDDWIDNEESQDVE